MTDSILRSVYSVSGAARQAVVQPHGGRTVAFDLSQADKFDQVSLHGKARRP